MKVKVAPADEPDLRIQPAVVSSPVLNGAVPVGLWRRSEVLEQAQCQVQSDNGTILDITTERVQEPKVVCEFPKATEEVKGTDRKITQCAE